MLTFFSVFVSARYVFEIPDWCHHLLLTARMFIKSSLESYLDWYIGMKIEQVTQEHRLVGLIKLLEGTSFYFIIHPSFVVDCSYVCQVQSRIIPRLVHWKENRTSHPGA